MRIHPELEAAIERNKQWIKKKCKISERRASKCEELVNDVFLNLFLSDKNFSQKETVNPDAWVKKITTNITASYKNEQRIEKETISENVDNLEIGQHSTIEAVLDLKVAIEYIRYKNMDSRDREIMFLYLMQEPHSSIAEIIGLKAVTITNIISARKKELNEYLNKGLI